MPNKQDIDELKQSISHLTGMFAGIPFSSGGKAKFASFHQQIPSTAQHCFLGVFLFKVNEMVMHITELSLHYT